MLYFTASSEEMLMENGAYPRSSRDMTFPLRECSLRCFFFFRNGRSANEFRKSDCFLDLQTFRKCSTMVLCQGNRRVLPDIRLEANMKRICISLWSELNRLYSLVLHRLESADFTCKTNKNRSKYFWKEPNIHWGLRLLKGFPYIIWSNMWISAGMRIFAWM
jgi:hypothetical protein